MNLSVLILADKISSGHRNEWVDLIADKRKYSRELVEFSEKIIEGDQNLRELNQDIRTVKSKIKECVGRINAIKGDISVLNSELLNVSDKLSSSKSFLSIMESRLPKEEQQTLLTEMEKSRNRIENSHNDPKFIREQSLEHYKRISMELEAIKAVKLVREEVTRLRTYSENLNDKIAKAHLEVSHLQSDVYNYNIAIDRLVSSKALVQKNRETIMILYNDTIKAMEEVKGKLDALATLPRTFGPRARYRELIENKQRVEMTAFRQQAQQKLSAGKKVTLEELRIALEEA